MKKSSTCNNELNIHVGMGGMTQQQHLQQMQQQQSQQQQQQLQGQGMGGAGPQQVGQMNVSDSLISGVFPFETRTLDDKNNNN